MPGDDGANGQRTLADAADHHFAAGFDALGDGDFALARQELDTAHLAQVHAHRIVGAPEVLVIQIATGGGFRLGGFRGGGGLLLALFGLDDVDAHLRDHGHGVLDLLGGNLLGRQGGVQFVVGDVAALLAACHHLLDGGAEAVEQRFGRGFFPGFTRFRGIGPFGRHGQLLPLRDVGLLPRSSAANTHGHTGMTAVHPLKKIQPTGFVTRRTRPGSVPGVPVFPVFQHTENSVGTGRPMADATPLRILNNFRQVFPFVVSFVLSSNRRPLPFGSHEKEAPANPPVRQRVHRARKTTTPEVACEPCPVKALSPPFWGLYGARAGRVKGCGPIPRGAFNRPGRLPSGAAPSVVWPRSPASYRQPVPGPRGSVPWFARCGRWRPDCPPIPR